MMKTEWNQKPVKNPVNPGADSAKPDHPFPERRNHRLNRRPHKSEDPRQNNGNQRRYNRNEPAPAENPRYSGSFVSLKRLYVYPAINPAIIPPKTAILFVELIDFTAASSMI